MGDAWLAVIGGGGGGDVAQIEKRQASICKIHMKMVHGARGTRGAPGPGQRKGSFRITFALLALLSLWLGGSFFSSICVRAPPDSVHCACVRGKASSPHTHD
jgi:hypothetical protein